MRSKAIILTSILLLLVLGLVYWFTLQRGKPEVPTFPSFKVEDRRAEFLSKLPIEADDFRIAYNPELSKSVIVEVDARNRGEFLKRKAEISQFIKNFQIEDLCALDVRFIPIEKSVKEEITDEDVFAQGCPIPTPASSPR